MIRQANLNDISGIMKIIQEAQKYFKENGIPQWQNGYPDEKQIQSDIEENSTYVLEEDNQIIGTFYITFKGDPYYKEIDGNWLNTNKYAAVHRIAVLPSFKGQGLAGKLFQYAEKLAQEQGLHDIRIDTHKLNRSMQNTLKKNGFIKCGNITIQNNEPRVAFQKEL